MFIRRDETGLDAGSRVGSVGDEWLIWTRTYLDFELINMAVTLTTSVFSHTHKTHIKMRRASHSIVGYCVSKVFSKPEIPFLYIFLLLTVSPFI